MRDLIRTFYPYLKRHKRPLLWGAFVVLATNYFYAQIPVFVGKTTDHIIAGGAMAGVWKGCLAILLLVGAGAVAHYYQRILIIVTSRHIEYEFRNDFFTHLLRLPPSFYDRMKTGDIVSRASGDIDQVRMVIGPGIMYPLSALTLAPITLYLMCKASWTAAIIAFLPLLSVPVLVNILSNIMFRRSLRIQEHFSEFSGRIQESLAGARVIRCFAQEAHEAETLDALNRKNAELNMDLARVQAVFRPILISIFVFGTLLIIWSSGFFVSNDPATLASDPRKMSVGQLLSFVMLYRNLFWPIMGLGWVVSVYQRGAASMRRILLILDQTPDIRDNEDTDPALTQIRGEIEFRNLEFRFPKSEQPALRQVSFRVPAGKTLGIVGPVGSGKSAIAAVIARLYDPPPGTVFLDGHDVRRFPLETLRRSVGMVFQETYLFSDTIRENIRFGTPNGIDEAAISEAARRAAVENDILAFPLAYETHLGERGVNLSGGQKQRVSLARALASNPSILILDDAFSSVDTQTEENILDGLREVLRKRTTLLISHRISTVQLADEIIVLDEGCIVERGTHEELAAKGGLYAQIYTHQLLEEAIERGEG